MLGAGTKTAITTARSFPALLDITRLTSRVGRGPHTGVDRVELAYLEWCLLSDLEFWGLAKVAGSFVLLDRSGLQDFYDKVIGSVPWGSRDLRAVVGIKTPAPRGAAESDLRRLAVHQTSLAGLERHLKEFAEAGFTYLNVGHSNISRDLFEELNGAGVNTAVFLHDLIPLELPELQRIGTSLAFGQKIEVATWFGGLILTNSADSAGKIRIHMKTQGRVSEVSFAHLGVSVPKASSSGIGNDRPYFVILGTIEPRKNHALLLDVWQDMSDELPDGDVPDLHIVGQRGWANEDVITRLNVLKDNPRIYEHNAMDDAQLWPLIQGAHGLLFPSLAEGFGLPSLEAAALGVPVICGDLAIHRELLGDYPVYASLQDRYLWKKTIIEQAGTRLEDLRKACAKSMPHIPTWDEHFDRINAAVMGSE